MAPRIPQAADFDGKCKVRVNDSGDGKAPSNVLVLLHGLGDNAENFGILGRRLNLPETLTIAIEAPTPLPFDLNGFHWGDDILFDQGTGQMDMDTGFTKATKLLTDDIVKHVLLHQCGYKSRQIHVFGLGQGGMVALSVARALADKEFGGVISMGGPLAQMPSDTSGSKSRTPVLVVHGSSKSAISTIAAKNIRNVFPSVTFHQWPRPSDGMPNSREEMLPIMQFLARRLQTTAGVPEGALEVT